MKHNPLIKRYNFRIAMLRVLLGILLFVSISCSSQYTDNLKGDSFIAVISDVHINYVGKKDKKLAGFINKINRKEINADMLVVTGDCVSSIHKDKNQVRNDTVNNRLLRFNNMMKKAEFPYFLVMGNHEHKIDKQKDSDAPFVKAEIDTAEAIWTNITGYKPFYSEIFKEWKFIIMNSMRGIYMNRRFDEEQITWLEKELDTDKSVLIFFHHPLETDNFRIWCKFKDLATTEIEPKFFKLLNNNKAKIKGIFVGHGHMFLSDKLFDQIQVYETSSFGDNEELTYSIIGLDHSNKSISVKKYDE